MFEKNAGYGDNFEHLEDICRYLSALADVRIAEVKAQENVRAESDRVSVIELSLATR